MFCLNDNFFDIVFNLKINNRTYDFRENKYLHTTKKNICQFSFIILNGFILLSCFYALIFIIIPIVYFRISQCSKKNPRFSDIKERDHISILKERFTSDA
jgi:predicted membrane protein